MHRSRQIHARTYVSRCKSRTITSIMTKLTNQSMLTYPVVWIQADHSLVVFNPSPIRLQLCQQPPILPRYIHVRVSHPVNAGAQYSCLHVRVAHLDCVLLRCSSVIPVETRDHHQALVWVQLWNDHIGSEGSVFQRLL